MKNIKVKICGIKTKEALEAAINAGASLVGFVHFQQSPRHIEPETAADLTGLIPASIASISVVVNPSDELIERIKETLNPGFIQLHGEETPERVYEIQQKFAVKIIKAIAVETLADASKYKSFEEISDIILFDAKAPKGSNLPGGNNKSFDWGIFEHLTPPKTWMLSGGLNEKNIQEAIRKSSAKMIDVSSGVESSPGVKDAAKIAGFISAVKLG